MAHHERMRVLIADDDRAIRESLARALELEGYEVAVVVDGVEALTVARRDRFDALVVDVMMPGVDGLAVCRVLRGDGDRTPVLMLTARVETPDRVAGLDAGADDYLPKPFALEELLARLRALLRRSRASEQEEGATLSFADLTLDPETREVRRGDRQIRLTRTEFSLLETLLRRPRRVLTRSQILEEVWGYDFPTSANSLEVYIGYLRRKTEEAGEIRLLHTVRGVGYVLRETPP
jgi:two-component system, OmpR family, response regulator MprA